LPRFELLFEVLLWFIQPDPPVCLASANLGDYSARQSTDIVRRKADLYDPGHRLPKLAQTTLLPQKIYPKRLQIRQSHSF
jgi:hypothetical protein